MHAALNCRLSRRSACDRCRGFKLRCERDQVSSRSCERCLKAQVPCTTSVGQPAHNYIPSKPGSGSMPGDFDGRMLNNERMSMPVLHRSSMSKVRKPLGSSAISRRHENQRFSGWIPSDTFSYEIAGSIPMRDDLGLPMPSHHNSTFPSEQWNGQYNSFPSVSHHLQPREDALLDHQFPCADQHPFPQALAMNMQPSVQNESTTDLGLCLNAESTNFTDQVPPTMTDDVWNQVWESKPESTAFNEPIHNTTMDVTPPGPYNLKKKLLRLNLDLIDDLELLEAGSMIMDSLSVLKEDFQPTVGKLDLPVFRMLSHSTQFLEILESGIGIDPFENSLSLGSTVEASRQASLYQEDTKSPSTDFLGGMDDGETTASTHDSGYLSMMDNSSERSKRSIYPKYEVSTALSILATYCHLVRVYRTIFTHLYQLFLIIPPADATAFLLLPSLQFSQFHMDGNLTVQVQVLIELSSSMLEKVERTLGLFHGSNREADGESSPVPYILSDSPLLPIRDHIMTQEQMAGGIPLRETMNCLRQLLKDPVNV